MNLEKYASEAYSLLMYKVAEEANQYVNPVSHYASDYARKGAMGFGTLGALAGGVAGHNMGLLGHGKLEYAASLGLGLAGGALSGGIQGGVLGAGVGALRGAHERGKVTYQGQY